MTVRILVDTNVILYSRDRRYPVKQARSAAWLKALSASNMLVISPQVAGEHQRNAQRKLGESQALAAEATIHLMTFCPGAPGVDLIPRALFIEARWRMAWWDAMHLAYASVFECTHFLTEDAQSAPMIEGVAIIDPFGAAPEDVLPGA